MDFDDLEDMMKYDFIIDDDYDAPRRPPGDGGCGSGCLCTILLVALASVMATVLA